MGTFHHLGVPVRARVGRLAKALVVSVSVVRGIVERYLEAVVAQDWGSLEGCLAEGVVRVGPFGDTYSPREPYVAFLAGLMPTLPGYSMRVDRVTYAGGRAFAELSETVEVDGAPLETPEALVFDLDEDGLISRIGIYIQRVGA